MPLYSDPTTSASKIVRVAPPGGNFGSSYSLDLSANSADIVQLEGTFNAASCTITVTNRRKCIVVLLGTQDATGGRAVLVSDGTTSIDLDDYGFPSLPNASGAASLYLPDATNMYIDVSGGGGAGGTVDQADIDAAIAAHLAASDPHGIYLLDTQRGAVSGVASLDGTTKVPVAELGTGTPNGSKFLRDDRTWAVPAGGGGGGRFTSGWTPTDSGWLTATADPSSMTTGTLLSGGTIHMARMAVPVDITVGKLAWHVTAGASGLTAGQNWAGLYSSTGTLIAKTADLTADYGAFYTEKALVAESGQSLSLTGGSTTYVYAAFVSNGTTRPTLLRSGSTSSAVINGNLGNLAHRCATGGTGATVLPATIATTTGSGQFFWAALVA